MKTTETEDVRQGETRPWVQRVLVISTVAAIIAIFTAMFIQ